jgi:hypothetical protein
VSVTPSFGEWGFMTSEEVFEVFDTVRRISHQFGLEMALNAEHLHAVLRETYPPGGDPLAAVMRARRVTRHAKQIGEAYRVAGQSAARTLATFRREFAVELGESNRAQPPKKRMTFQ